MTVGSQIDKPRMISTGSIEMDRKLGGGIPYGTLMLVEGAESSGKSTLVQQLIWSALKDHEPASLYMTEQTIQSLLRQMASLGIDIRDYFLMDLLQIYPIGTNSDVLGPEILFNELFSHIKGNEDCRILVVDSLTTLAADAGGVQIQDFFLKCKQLCDDGKVIIVTAHTNAFNEEILTRLRSVCDAFIRLDVHRTGNMLLKTLEVAKIRGADMKTGNILGFEIEPERGIRIIPISRAKA